MKKTKSKLLLTFILTLCMALACVMALAACSPKEIGSDPTPSVKPNDPDPATNADIPIVTAGNPDDDWNYVTTAPDGWTLTDGNLTGTYTYKSSRYTDMGDGEWQSLDTKIELSADGTIKLYFITAFDPDPSPYTGSYKVYNDGKYNYVVVTDLIGLTRGLKNEDGSNGGEGDAHPNAGANIYSWIDDDGNCVLVLISDSQYAPYCTEAGSIVEVTSNYPAIEAGQDDSDWLYITSAGTDWQTSEGTLSGKYTYDGSRYNKSTEKWEAIKVSLELNTDATVKLMISVTGSADEVFEAVGYTTYENEEGDTYVIVKGLINDGSKPNDGNYTYYWIGSFGNCVLVLTGETTFVPLVDTDPDLGDSLVAYIYTAPKGWIEDVNATVDTSVQYTYSGKIWSKFANGYKNLTATLSFKTNEDNEPCAVLNYTYDGDNVEGGNEFYGSYKIYSINGVTYVAVTGLSNTKEETDRNTGETVTKTSYINSGDATKINWISSDGEANAVLVLGENSFEPFYNPVEDDSATTYFYEALVNWVEDTQTTIKDGTTYSYATSAQWGKFTNSFKAAPVDLTFTTDESGNKVVEVSYLPAGDTEASVFYGSYKLYTVGEQLYVAIIGASVEGEDRDGNPQTNYLNGGDMSRLYWADRNGNAVFALYEGGGCEPFAHPVEHDDIVTYAYTADTSWTESTATITDDATYEYYWGVIYGKMASGIWKAAPVTVKLYANGTAEVTYVMAGNSSTLTGTYKIYTDTEGNSYAVISGLKTENGETPNSGMFILNWTNTSGEAIFALNEDGTCAPAIADNGNN